MAMQGTDPDALTVPPLVVIRRRSDGVLAAADPRDTAQAIGL